MIQILIWRIQKTPEKYKPDSNISSDFDYTKSNANYVPVNQYKNDPNTPIKSSIKYPTTYPIELEGTRIKNKEEYDLFFKK